MIQPVIYSIITLLLTGIIAFILALFIFRKLRHDKESLGLGLYILSGPTLLFFLQGIGLTLRELGYPEIDRILFMPTVLLPLVFFFIYYSLLMRITQNNSKNSLIGSIILALILVPGSIALITGSFEGPIVNDWGTQYVFTGLAVSILMGPIIKNTLCLIDIVSKVIKWIKTKKIEGVYHVAIDVALIIIGIAVFIYWSGWFDAGWQLFMFRIMILISVLIAYLAYTGKEVKTKFQI